MQRTPDEKRAGLISGVAGGLSGAAVNWVLTHLDRIAWEIGHGPTQLRYPIESAPPFLVETLYRLGWGCLFGAIASFLPLKKNRIVFWIGAVAGFIAATFLIGPIQHYRE
jgi:hypothetical protein